MARRLTKEERAAIDAVATLPDNRIDLADPDAPEVTSWTGAERGRLFRPVKRQLTLRIDADIIEWFRSHSEKGGRPYQTEINAALRDYVERRKREPRRR
jgi:uncharacterized protein (DUF4415 family)